MQLLMMCGSQTQLSAKLKGAAQESKSPLDGVVVKYMANAANMQKKDRKKKAFQQAVLLLASSSVLSLLFCFSLFTDVVFERKWGMQS